MDDIVRSGHGDELNFDHWLVLENRHSTCFIESICIPYNTTTIMCAFHIIQYFTR